MKRMTGACTLALAMYATLPMGLDGLVLCIGDDGHVAVESVGGACCGHEEQYGGGLHESDACGPCLDIPFLSVADRTASNRQLLRDRHASSLQTIPPPAELFTSGPVVRPHPDIISQSATIIYMRISVVLLT